MTRLILTLSPCHPFTPSGVPMVPSPTFVPIKQRVHRKRRGQAAAAAPAPPAVAISDVFWLDENNVAIHWVDDVTAIDGVTSDAGFTCNGHGPRQVIQVDTAIVQATFDAAVEDGDPWAV